MYSTWATCRSIHCRSARQRRLLTADAAVAAAAATAEVISKLSSSAVLNNPKIVSSIRIQ